MSAWSRLKVLSRALKTELAAERIEDISRNFDPVDLSVEQILLKVHLTLTYLTYLTYLTLTYLFKHGWKLEK